MSYIVSYEPELARRYPSEKNQHKKLPVKKILLLLMICGSAYAFVSFNLARYLIPGDPEVTTEAFSNMMCDIKDGETVGSAITAFVEDVLAGGR